MGDSVAGRGDRFDRLDFDLRVEDLGDDDEVLVVPPQMLGDLTVLAERWAWPIDPRAIKRVGDSVTDSRPGKHRPHEGLDIFASARTRVFAATNAQVLRVVDGRKSKNRTRRAAGLFVDLLTRPDGNGTRWIHRYLHLGAVRPLVAGQSVEGGSPIGEVAEAHTSGLAAEPHLHFEVREVRPDRSYGPPVDPRRYLPSLERTA